VPTTEVLEVHVLARAGHDIVKVVIVEEKDIETGAVGAYFRLVIVPV
jgi:hypothetical protein